MTPGDPLSALPLEEVLGRLAARTPAPGGGTAAALVGGVSAALVEMAAAFAHPPAAGAGDRAGQLRRRLVELAERDELAYAPVLEALRRPAEDVQRAARVASSLAAAAAVPLEIAEASAELAGLARDVTAAATRELAGDGACAAVLAEAACRAAAVLVQINLRGTADPRREEVDGLIQAAGVARKHALEKATES